MRVFIYMVIALLTISCQEKDTMQSKLPQEIRTDMQSAYEIDAEPDVNFSVNFSIIEPTDCVVESDQEWCMVKETLETGRRNITLKFKSNDTADERLANVTISTPKVKGTVHAKIKQKGAQFSLSGIEEDLSPEGGEYKLTLAAGKSWNIECDADWIRLDKNSGESTTEPVEITMTVEPNETGIIRMAKIALKLSDGKNMSYELLQTEPWTTGKRIGDAGLAFDESKIDPEYPQIAEWIKAGRAEGIPSLDALVEHNNNRIELNPEMTADDINTLLNTENKYDPRLIFLKNGTYTFDKEVRIFSQDVMVGESRDGVIINFVDNPSIDAKKKAKISLYNGNNIGLRNLTIVGKWMSEEPDPTKMENVLPDLSGHKMIDMNQTEKSYVDNVRIVNSASHPIWITPDKSGNKGNYNTIRDLDIDGAYNKGGGCEGYFFVGGSYNLITGCKVVHLRHISFQNETSEYNVFYKNDVNQEVSFHVGDGGNNLIENNKITIPETLQGYNAIMGPWSSQHHVGGLNFVYRNRCLENNRGGLTPWSDNELYIGPWEVSVGADNPTRYTNFRVTEGYLKPVGRTFYPIILK